MTQPDMLPRPRTPNGWRDANGGTSYCVQEQTVQDIASVVSRAWHLVALPSPISQFSRCVCHLLQSLCDVGTCGNLHWIPGGFLLVSICHRTFPCKLAFAWAPFPRWESTILLWPQNSFLKLTLTSHLPSCTVISSKRRWGPEEGQMVPVFL